MITSVRLQNFRSYSDTTFDFKAGTHVIYGPNGAGKTNILEAIYTTFYGSSWRGKDALLIKQDADWARVDVTTDSDDIFTLKLTARQSRIIKTQAKNDNQKEFNPPPITLFEPDFIQTVTDQPGLRRDWLDTVLVQIQPGYKQHVDNYRRALTQRNQLLKRGQTNSHHIFVWNLKLSEYGAIVSAARQNLVIELADDIAGEYQRIANSNEAVEVVYRPEFGGDYASAMLKTLANNLKQDTRLGFTTCGPHREDMDIMLRNQPLTDTASRGEARTLATALKNAEHSVTGSTVVFYDDVSSELDAARAGNVSLPNSKQTIITQTDKPAGKNIQNIMLS